MAGRGSIILNATGINIHNKAVVNHITNKVFGTSNFVFVFSTLFPFGQARGTAWYTRQEYPYLCKYGRMDGF